MLIIIFRPKAHPAPSRTPGEPAFREEKNEAKVVLPIILAVGIVAILGAIIFTGRGPRTPRFQAFVFKKHRKCKRHGYPSEDKHIFPPFRSRDWRRRASCSEQ
ncbi:hypothetical protein MTO96_025176 [Rhipicephalus appendiculatus]